MLDHIERFFRVNIFPAGEIMLRRNDFCR